MLLILIMLADRGKRERLAVLMVRYQMLSDLVCDAVPALDRIFQEKVVIKVECQQNCQAQHEYRGKYAQFRVQQNKSNNKELAKDYHYSNYQVDEPFMLEYADFFAMFRQEILGDLAFFQCGFDLRFVLPAPLLHVYAEFIASFHCYLLPARLIIS